MAYIRQVFGYSERRVCRALGQSRGAYRKPTKPKADEAELTEDIVRLAKTYGRYGYRRVAALLRIEGWQVNHKRVERIWRQEGLKVPQRHKKRGRLYLNDGSCIRLRACWKNHVWSYDFVADRLLDGTKIRFLTLVDEYTRECLALKVNYKLKAHDVLDTLAEVFKIRGLPDYIRSDNGSEFTAKILQDWLKKLDIKTAFITPGSPWENGFNESFNGKFRDEFLACEQFYSLKEAQVLTQQWRYHYNHIRPHTSLGYKPPASMSTIKEGDVAHAPSPSLITRNPHSKPGLLNGG